MPAEKEMLSEDELLRYAATIEKGSEHPIGRAIVNFAEEKNLTLYNIANFQSHSGMGVEATVNGRHFRLGKPGWFEENLFAPPGVTGGETVLERVQNLQSKGKTVVLLAEKIAKKDILMGIISVSDLLKPDSARAIEELHNEKIKVVMITGDNIQTARAIAREAGIHQENIEAEIKPDGKADRIRALQSGIFDSNKKSFTSNTELKKTTGSNNGHVRRHDTTNHENPGSSKSRDFHIKSSTKPILVGMVGDGINDAPALACADVGFAIGTGTDIAIEAGDVILSSGALTGIPKAIQISRDTLNTIRQNLFLAFFYNIILIPVAAGILAPFEIFPEFLRQLHPILAALAMAASSISVVSNSLRLYTKNSV